MVPAPPLTLSNVIPLPVTITILTLTGKEILLVTHPRVFSHLLIVQPAWMDDHHYCTAPPLTTTFLHPWAIAAMRVYRSNLHIEESARRLGGEPLNQSRRPLLSCRERLYITLCIQHCPSYCTGLSIWVFFIPGLLDSTTASRFVD